MRQIIKDDLPLWQFTQLSGHADVKHFVSGRKGGKSAGDLSSLNLSYSVGDEVENVNSNRRRITEALDISQKDLIIPGQTHSTNVKILSNQVEISGLDCTDALVTDIPNICIAVLAADCVPILIYDPKRKVIAAVHSGWKGTVGKILANTVKRMKDNFHSEYADLLVAIGPSIGPDVYEVGENVITAAREAYPNDTTRILKPSTKPGKAFFNLWEANRIQLTELNIPTENIEVANICTLSNSDIFFSARASKGGAGRFGAGIMLL